MIRYWFILGLLLSVVAPPAGAASQVGGLYEVRVPVADQSAAERDRALTEALREVVVRATGSRQAANDQNLPNGAGAVDRIVQQYGYLTTPDGLELHVRFDPAAVEQMLRQRGLPVWGSERPTTLVWLAIQDGADRRLVSADDTAPAGQAFRQAARARAVPVMLPLQDLEDQSKVRFADIWGGFFDDVLSASARYQADAILIGRLQRQSGGWSSRWNLYDRGQPRQWNASGEDLAAATAAGADGLADTLSARYAERPDATGALDQVRVRIDDVRTLDDYAGLSTFLRSRELVSAARLVSVTGDQAYFELSVRGSAERLQRTLALWSRLAAVAPAANDPGSPVDSSASSAELHFRLVP